MTLRAKCEFIFAALFIVLVWFVVVSDAQPEENTFTVTLRHDTGTQDREFEYFRLVAPDATAVLVIGDKDLKLTQWLVDNANHKLHITAQPVTVQRIER